MFVIPIEESLIYVEPVYIEAANESSLPEVKRVIVAYGDKIAYEATLAEALDKLFGTGTDFIANYYGGVMPTPPEESGDTETDDGSTATVDQLIAAAVEAYNNAANAQKNGDWAAYGKYLDELGDYLNQLTGADVSMEVDDIMQDATGLRTIEDSNINPDTPTQDGIVNDQELE